jgi:hypothetical protein
MKFKLVQNDCMKKYIIEPDGREEIHTTSLFSERDSRRTFMLTLAHSENKSDELYTPDLQRMAKAIGTKACETEFMTIGYEHENIKMAIKMKSQVPAKRIVKKIYAFFKGYSREVEFDPADTRTYLELAACIIAPLEPRDVDPAPLIFGDKTLGDLLRRIDNSRRGQRATKNVAVKLFPIGMGTKERYEKGQELVDDLVCAHGSWASVMKSPKYQKIAQENIGFLREHFNFFSAEVVSDDFSEQVIEDVSNGTLEHHGTMGCTQDEYDQWIEAKYHSKVRNQKRTEESIIRFARLSALATGRIDPRTTSDDQILDFTIGGKRSRALKVGKANARVMRKSVWASRRL